MSHEKLKCVRVSLMLQIHSSIFPLFFLWFTCSDFCFFLFFTNAFLPLSPLTHFVCFPVTKDQNKRLEFFLQDKLAVLFPSNSFAEMTGSRSYLSIRMGKIQNLQENYHAEEAKQNCLQLFLTMKLLDDRWINLPEQQTLCYGFLFL